MLARPGAAPPSDDPDRVKLLNGPYRPPRLRGGRGAFCQYRGRAVVVTGRSDGRLPWPWRANLSDLRWRTRRPFGVIPGRGSPATRTAEPP
jgi:hypothetical protein